MQLALAFPLALALVHLISGAPITTAEPAPIEATILEQPVVESGWGLENKPLVFMMTVNLNEVINGMNGICYSNVITVPGPAGYGDPDKVWEQSKIARQAVEGYKDAFLAKCAKRGTVRASSFYYIANDSPNNDVEAWYRRQEAKPGMPKVTMP